MARMIEVRILHHRIPNTSRGEEDPTRAPKVADTGKCKLP